MSKKDIKDLNNTIEKSFGTSEFFGKKDKIELIDKKIVTKEDTPMFFYLDGNLVPTLHLLLKESILKKVVVDMGAIRFVVKGADIMRPGITEIDLEIKEGEYIVIVDETHGKPLAVGKAKHDGKTMQELDSGKVIKNLHYVGDEIWEQNL